MGAGIPKMGAPGGAQRKRKFSKEREEKKALRAVLTTGGHFQKAIMDCEKYLSIEVAFRDIFERVEKRLIEMDVGKKKFGGK